MSIVLVLELYQIHTYVYFSTTASIIQTAVDKNNCKQSYKWYYKLNDKSINIL